MTSVVFLTRRTAGGIKAHILSLADALDKERYYITVIGPIGHDFAAKLKHKEINYIHVNIADKINPFLDVTSTLSITRLLRKIKPDILHIHGNKSALIGRWAAKMANVDKVIVTVHNFLIYQQKKGLVSKLAFFEERRLSKSTSHIIAVSEQIKQRLMTYEGIDERKLTVINNGIDIDSFKPLNNGFRRKYMISQDAFIALNIGRLVEFKGQRYLLEAAAILQKRMPDFKLILAGTGPLKRELMEYSLRLGLDNTVIFLDQTADTAELYSIADCFVLPSIDEPFGLVLLEAMAHKLPIVAARSSGVLDILDEGKALLVDTKSAEKLADAIIRIAREKKLSNNLSKNAYQLLQNKFSLNQMVEETEKLYQSLAYRPL